MIPRISSITAAIAMAVLLGACGSHSHAGTPSGGDSASMQAHFGSPRQIHIEYAHGRVSGSDTYQVTLNRQVRLQVSADVTDEVHVHGYDRKADVSPGHPAIISFTANVPGRFEVELENARRTLTQLEVH